jgi:SMC interacting uncharacterized protein involved in chromosome segregation
MVFYMLQTLCSYYFKSYDLFNKEASEEDKDAEDNSLVNKMVMKLNISEKDFMLIREEIKNLKVQLEDPVEEAARRELRDLEAGAASLLNELKKQQDCVKEKENYKNELHDKIAKLLSNNDVLKARIKKAQADILRMKHVVENQTITLEDKKRIESECIELQETIRMNEAFCDALSKNIYSDDLKIAKLKNELNSKCIEYNLSIMEYANDLPDLDHLKMPMKFLHKDTDIRMQVSSVASIPLHILEFMGLIPYP